MKAHWKGNVVFYSIVVFYTVITFWLLWPYDPITINSIDIMNEDNIAYVAETLNYETDYVKKKSYPVVKVTRQLIGKDKVFILQPGEGSIPVGSHRVNVTLDIPEYVCPDSF